MTSSDQIAAIFNRIFESEQTDADLEILKTVLISGSSSELLQLGKYNINIGQGQDINIGDRNYVEWNEESIQALIAVVKNHLPQVTGISENLPRSGVVEFIGREHELSVVHQQLQYCKPGVVAAITGMGGIGKTELALQYATIYKSHYSGGVLWLQARGVDVSTQIIQYARSRLQLNPSEELDILAQVGFCWTYWPAGPVLIVIDDVTDYRLVKSFLPPSEARFKVLITTRFRPGRSVYQVELNVLDEFSSLKILNSLIGESRVSHELDAGKQLCSWLGYLPLGLELVGRYLDRKPDLSFDEMLQRLKEKSLEERSLRKPDSDMTQPLGVAAAFDLTWETLNEESQRLSCLLSLFALAPIPWQLVEQISVDQDLDEIEEIRDDYLVGFHLLQRKTKSAYQLHQLVKEFLLEKLETLDYGDEQREKFCEIMAQKAKQIPESPTREFLAQSAMAMPHIAETATTFVNYLADDELTYPFEGLIRFYENQGMYDRAEEWCVASCEVTKGRCNENSCQHAISLSHKGRIAQLKGRYQEAESVYNQVLEIRKTLLSQSSTAVAEVLNDLAVVKYKQGEYTDAQALFSEALDIWEKAHDPMHSSIGDCLNNLGMLYNELGQYQEAMSILSHALEIRQGVFGEDHPRIATSLSNLAHCYSAQGKHDQAQPLYWQSLEMFQQLLGEEHPSVAEGLNNLGMYYVAQGKYDEAMPLLIQSLSIHRQIYGEKHPSVAMSLNNLAYLYDLKEQYDKAEPLYIDSLNMRKELLGPDHPYVGISLNNLATLFRMQNLYDEARSLYEQSIEILSKHLELSHPLMKQVEGNLEKLRGQDDREN